MDYRILGPLHIAWGDDNRPDDLRNRRETRILGALLLSPNRAVSVSELVDVVWPSAPPATARQQLQNCASALRRGLLRSGLPPLRTVAGGYRVEVAVDRLDALLFEQWVLEARQALTHHDLPSAAAKLTDALRLWRGDVLGGVSMGPFDASVARLQELRLSAQEDRFDIALATGMTGAVRSDLIACAQAHPLREKFTVQLMRALAGDGRPAEAVDLFHTTRLNLVSNYGIEPSPLLSSAYTQIVLAAPPPGLPSAEHLHPGPSGLSTRPMSSPAGVKAAVTAALAQLDRVRTDLQRALDADTGQTDTVAVA